jgi:hypothetical protein
MADSLIPAKLVAGNAWSWPASPAGYGSDLFDLKLYLRGPKAADKLDLTAAAADGSFLFSATKTQTQTLSGGSYAWQIDAVEKATTDAVTLASGTLQVDTSLALQTSGGTDSRSHVKKMLDAVEAVLEGRASRVESEYQINGRMFKLLTPNELLELRGYYFNLYQKEQRANGTLQTSSQVEAVFREAR